MNFFDAVGRATVEQVRSWTYVAAVICAVFGAAVDPRTWRRTIREAFERQILFSGVEAIRMVSVIAFLFGLSVVVQVELWLRRFGQSRLLGPVLVSVVVRELGPLLANIVLIGRSGNAIASELASMTISGEVRALDAQGLDPFLFLVVPRVLGMAVSAVCLTVLFILVCLFSGYLCADALGVRTGGASVYLYSIAAAMGPADVPIVITKAGLPALLAGTICCVEGLGVAPAATEVTRATTRALQRSVLTLFITSALISVLSYV